MSCVPWYLKSLKLSVALKPLKKTLVEKWKHVMLSADNFQSELIRWKRHCSLITIEKSITNLLCEDADPIFFPNVRELLTILAVLPIGSVQAERSFSCLRQIHTWLRNRMTGERLGNLGVIALHGYDYALNTSSICESYIQKYPRRMCLPCVLYDS